ncbi:MAG: CRTAC1 family protein [Bacteroidetes bacterium]|nr:MAG: CRTAC1 family protein [Bacteroidota bacterium]
MKKVAYLLLLGLVWGCTPPDPGQARLEAQRRLSYHPDNRFQNALRIAYYDSLRAQASSEQAGFEYTFLGAVERLRAGHSQAAADSLALLRRRLAASPDWPESQRQANDHMLARYEALAYLRLGEQENCIMDHGVASCILPIRAGGMHHQPEGSRAAARLYRELLDRGPVTLGDRWLYTIAQMTLGNLSADDPWALPDTVFADPGGAPFFRDVAPERGLDVTGLSGGVVVDDLDGDGSFDVLVSSWGPRDQLRLFLQKSPGQFTEHTEAAGLMGVTGGLNMVHADYDNDGRLDVLILRGAWMDAQGELPNTLLRNLGDGRFEDVSWAAGLRSALPTQTAVWRDFDNDGWLDLFIGNETMSPLRPHPCELFLNQGDGTFTEIARFAGVGVLGFVKAVASADFDHNGYPDLFLSTQQGSDRFFLNQGPQGDQPVVFEERTEAAGLGGEISSFPAWAFDYDHDGWDDIYVSGLQIGKYRDALDDVARDHLGLPTAADKARLWRNNGDGTFTDMAPALGLDGVMLAMGSNFGDFNNDGWLDLYLGTGEPRLDVVVPNRAFLNLEGKAFREVSFSSGLGHIQKGHGISFADLDSDGDQDIYAVMGGAYEGDVYANVLFDNTYDGGNHWLRLRLEGTSSNRAGIGTRVRLVLPGGEVRHFTLNSGGSFGASPLEGHYGLGQAAVVDSLVVDWPAGGREVFLEVKADQRYRLVEGEGALLPISAKPPG